jgi:hypothetical protein
MCWVLTMILAPPSRPGIMANTTVRTTPTATHRPISNFFLVDQVVVCLDFGFLRRVDFWLSSLRDILLNPPDLGRPFPSIYHKSAGERGQSPSFQILDCPFASFTCPQTELNLSLHCATLKCGVWRHNTAGLLPFSLRLQCRMVTMQCSQCV